MFVLIVAVFCACVVLWWCARVRESRAHPLPPSFPHKLPIIGHLHILFTNAANIWEMFKNFAYGTVERGGVAYTNFGPDIYYFITDPDDALIVANTCLQKHFAYTFTQNYLGQGLITRTATLWQPRRKLMNPMFSLPVVRGFLEVFNGQSKVLLSTIDPYVGKGKFDFLSQIKKTILEISFMTAFGGSKIKENNSFIKYMNALQKYSKTVIQRFQKFWLHNDTIYKLSGLSHKEAELVKIMRTITDGAVHEKRLSSKNGINSEATFSYSTTDIGYQPLVERMLQLINNDTFTDHDIREELDTTITAAYDTSHNLFINLLAMIGSYPEVQAKIYEEIMQVIGPERDVEKEDLQKLVYTDAVIKETLRMFPPVPLIARYVDKDVKLKNYTLRAGTQCLIFIIGMHHHPSWGADADQFRPERWRDAATLPKNPNTFAAFSLGKRSCIGKTYAMTSAKVMLTHVVREYRLTADHTKMQFEFDITLKSVAGHEVGLQRRN